MTTPLDIDAIVTVETDLLPDIPLLGHLTWFSEHSATKSVTVERAVQRADGKELFLDCTSIPDGESAGPYRVLLRRDSSRTFAGLIVSTLDNRPVGTCTCRFYTNGFRFALNGRWCVGELSCSWIAELSPR